MCNPCAVLCARALDGEARLLAGRSVDFDIGLNAAASVFQKNTARVWGDVG